MSELHITSGGKLMDTKIMVGDQELHVYDLKIEIDYIHGVRATMTAPIDSLDIEGLEKNTEVVVIRKDQK